MNKSVLLTLLLMVTLPLCAQSDAYLHYSQNPNLDVAFIENLRIDDTIILDVTVILAKDSATFVWLMKEFFFTQTYTKAVSDNALDNKNLASFTLISKKHPFNKVFYDKVDECDFVLASTYYKRINIYHTRNKQQIKPLIKLATKTITPKLNNK